jgi:hypothetical protein
LVAYTLTALIGQMAHRRLTTDDGVTAAEAADSSSRWSSRGCDRTGADPHFLVIGCGTGRITNS